MDKPHMPRTRTQKGRMWATVTLVACGAYSIWANVTSGQLLRDNIVTSVAPPVVLFLTVHLISYLNPNKKAHVVLGYFGLGIVSLVAFGVSGFHIVEKTIESGQILYVAIGYPLIVDVPMLISAVVLVQKVSMTQTGQKETKQTETTEPPKKAVQAKATPKSQTAPPAPKTPAKRTSRAKVAAPQEPDKTTVPDIKFDAFEQDMLNV